MAIEAEIKLRIPDAHIAEKLMSDPLVASALREPFKETRMDAVYYDSAAGALTSRKWALRLRREDDVPVVTMKTPSDNVLGGGVFCRNEWQVTADSIEEGVPQLVEMGAPAEIGEIVKNTPMQEKCRIRFTRRSAVLYLPDGVRIDMAIDSGDVSAGEKHDPMLELELELLFGDSAAMVRLSTELVAKYSLEKEYISKYERALRLIRSRR